MIRHPWRSAYAHPLRSKEEGTLVQQNLTADLPTAGEWKGPECRARGETPSPDSGCQEFHSGGHSQHVIVFLAFWWFFCAQRRTILYKSQTALPAATARKHGIPRTRSNAVGRERWKKRLRKVKIGHLEVLESELFGNRLKDYP